MISSVYIHIPFCLSKCRYCGFNSTPAPSIEQVERYCRALQQEIRISKFEFRNLTTVYFGGGTPTVLDPKNISGIISALREKSGIREEAEVTIEANPETVDPTKLRSLWDMGFNRLSLGVQSFDDGTLKFLGRVHDCKKALQAFEQARRAGFNNVGIDLIYGVPEQGLGQWRSELEKAAELDPEHISAYSLTYEPGTEFTAWRDSGRIMPCQEELEAEMFLTAIDILDKAGYQHYEVSNFAKPGYRSRHNLNYWKCGDYLGLGAGAHSHQGGRRWANVVPYAEYSEMIEKGGKAIAFEETLTREQRLFEAIFLGLRMVEGIGIKEFNGRWGLSPLDYKPEAWNKLLCEGMATLTGTNLRLSARGMLLADGILSELVP